MSMSVRAGLAPRVPAGTALVSMRSIANSLHTSFPVAFRDIAGLLDPITLDFQLSAAACSGSCQIHMRPDGFVRFTGHVHDSGALAASYGVITSFPTLTEQTNFSPEESALVAALGRVVIPHQGHVGGTLSFDSRDSDWDKSAINPHIAANWAGAKAAARSARADFRTDSGVLELFDGFANLAAGTFVFSL